MDRDLYKIKFARTQGLLIFTCNQRTVNSGKQNSIASRRFYGKGNFFRLVRINMILLLLIQGGRVCIIRNMYHEGNRKMQGFIKKIPVTKFLAIFR